MSEKRRDNRNRILNNGEMQLADGRYRFKYEKSAYQNLYQKNIHKRSAHK